MRLSKKSLYDQIGLQLAGQYLISYTSNLPADGTNREVQVRYQDSMSAKSYQAPSTNPLVMWPIFFTNT
jgi:hypothetical protein